MSSSQLERELTTAYSRTPVYDSAWEISRGLTRGSSVDRPSLNLLEQVCGPSQFGEFGPYGILPNVMLGIAFLEAAGGTRKNSGKHSFLHYFDGGFRPFLLQRLDLRPEDKHVIYAFMNHDDAEDLSDSIEEAYFFLYMIGEILGERSRANSFLLTNMHDITLSRLKNGYNRDRVIDRGKIKRGLEDTLGEPYLEIEDTAQKFNRVLLKISDLARDYEGSRAYNYLVNKVGDFLQSVSSYEDKIRRVYDEFSSPIGELDIE